MEQSCSHSNAICTHNHPMQNAEEEPIELETLQTATAAHTMFFSSSPAATPHEKKGFVLWLPPNPIAPVTFTQPLQFHLPPQCETHSTGITYLCKTHRRNNSRMKRPQPHPAHRRDTFHRRLKPLYTEKIQGFLVLLSPQ